MRSGRRRASATALAVPAALILAAFLVAAAAAAQPPAGPVVCFYGPPPLEKLAAYPTVVVQPSLVSPSDVAYLRSRGCRVLGYVSLGEDDRLRRGNGRGPGGYAAWYLDQHTGPGFSKPGADDRPDTNPDWASYYVDPSDRGWRRAVKREVRRIRDDLGMDGVFADTALLPRDAFTQRLEARMVRGMEKLLSSLKGWSRGGIVVVNNGVDVAARLGARIDGVMIETGVEPGPDGWRPIDLSLGHLDAARRRRALLVTALVYLPAGVTPREACDALNATRLPAALYRDDAAGRALTSLPIATCP